MKRMVDDIQKSKSAPRVWRFRRKIPDHTFLFVSPLATVFSPWTKTIGFAVTLLLGPALAFSVSTNAAFSDADKIRTSGIGAGEWVPDIRFEEKEGCVKLSSSLSNAVIYYKFSDDGDPRTNGAIFDGSCIDILEEKETISFEARAFHPENDAWRSEVIQRMLSREAFQKKDRDKNHRKDDNEEERRDRDGDDTDPKKGVAVTCNEEAVSQGDVCSDTENGAVTSDTPDEDSKEYASPDKISDDDEKARGAEVISSSSEDPASDASKDHDSAQETSRDDTSTETSKESPDTDHSLSEKEV
jgi:hypothetical protein